MIKKIKEWQWVILVGLLALFLRVFQLPYTMPMTYDQGRDLLVLKEIAGGDLKMVGPTTGLPGIFLGPFMYYFLLPGYVIGQGNPYVVAYWHALWISLGLIASFYLLKKTVSKGWAWFGFSWLVISPGSITDGRVIWNPSLSAMILLPSWLSLALIEKSGWWLVPAVTLFGLSLQTELAYAFFLWPLYAWWVWRNWRTKHLNLKHILVAGAFFAITLLPQMAFEVKHSFGMTKSILHQFTAQEKQVSYFKIWKDRPFLIARSLDQSVLGMGQLPVKPALIGWIAIIALWYWTTRKKQLSPLAKLIAGATALPIIGMMLFRGNEGAFYDYYLQPHYAPIILTLTILLSQLPNRMRWIGATLATIIAVGAFLSFGRVIFNPAHFQYSIAHEVAALRYIREVSTSNPTSLVVYVPNLVPTQYDFVNQWLNRQGHQVNLVTEVLQGEYFVLYEPTFPGASEEAFNQWYQRQVYQAKCDTQKGFGILTVERCFKVDLKQP